MPKTSVSFRSFQHPLIQEFSWLIAHKRESVQDRTPVSATVNMQALRSELRTAIKHVRKAISSSDKTNAQTVLRASVATIDSIADKGIIHKNKAASAEKPFVCCHQDNGLSSKFEKKPGCSPGFFISLIFFVFGPTHSIFQDGLKWSLLKTSVSGDTKSMGIGKMMVLDLSPAIVVRVCR